MKNIVIIILGFFFLIKGADVLISGASGIAKNLIEYGKNHKKTTKSFGELVASFMPDYFPTHHDSVDSRTVIMLLEDEFSKGGYEVSSLNPFRISQC